MIKIINRILLNMNLFSLLLNIRAETIPRVTRVTRIQKIIEANYVPRGIV